MAVCYQCNENICSEACKEAHYKGGIVLDQIFEKLEPLEDRYRCTGTPKSKGAKRRAEAAWRDACNSAMGLLQPPQQPNAGSINDFDIMALDTCATVSSTTRVQDISKAVPVEEGESISIRL